MLDLILKDITPATLAFIVFITICAFCFHAKFTVANANKAPAILTTCGILGTFFGIAIGLLHFNPEDIQKSVPALIDGIKTAFWVSAYGIFWALTIKMREAFLGVPKSSITPYQGATVDDLAALLGDVKSALVGSEESTLLGQIKLARQDSNDRIDALRKSLDEFCNKVAENNSKALIEALKEVIRDFNTKINEQFGENFKQLNEAVGRILEWQEKYRQQVSEMILQQSEASKNMATATVSMASATDRYQALLGQAEVFNTIAANMSQLLKSLSELLPVIDGQRKQMEESLKLLGTVINSAATGLPEIEKKVVGITDQLTRSVKATNDEFKDQLLSNVRSSSQELGGLVRNTIKELSDGVKASNEDMKSNLLNTIQKSNQEFNTHIQKVNQEINGNIKLLVDQTKDQVVLLDKALSEELTKSLETLGRQLASLSQRFVEDYTPLTNKLREIVEISRRAS